MSLPNTALPAESGPACRPPNSRRLALLVPLCLALVLILFAAHWLRMGLSGPVAACLVLLLPGLCRQAWTRWLFLVLSAGVGCFWMGVCSDLLRVRLALDEPWGVLVAILTTVAACSFGTAALVAGPAGRAWFCRHPESARDQLAAFVLVLALLAPLLMLRPDLLVFERLWPGFALVQELLAAWWGASVTRWLGPGKGLAAHRARLVVWRLFSLVFFAQFLLAGLGLEVFFMTGAAHIPVPGVVVGGAVLRGEPGFMGLLFLVSVLVLGSAWCSHLCYFGCWDAAAAQAHPATIRGKRSHPLAWRAAVLVLTIAVAACLRALSAPLSLAVGCGILLGLLLVPVALWGSRRQGRACYCVHVCPLGLLAVLLGKLSVWRVRQTAACRHCLACARVCRYGALDAERLRNNLGPGLSCTLCRDCLLVCPHKGMALGTVLDGLVARKRLPLAERSLPERLFVVLVASVHAVFLCTAMV